MYVESVNETNKAEVITIIKMTMISATPCSDFFAHCFIKQYSSACLGGQQAPERGAKSQFRMIGVRCPLLDKRKQLFILDLLC